MSFSYAADSSENEVWYGIPLPDSSGDSPNEIYRQQGFRDIQLQETEAHAATADITADELIVYVGEQMAISQQSRDTGDLIWGRVAGRSGGRMMTEYVRQKFEEYGLEDIEVVPVTMPPQVWPDKAKFSLLASSARGNSLQDYFFKSMMPQPKTPGTGGGDITAELIYAGYGRDIDLAGKDFTGKGAIVRARPLQGGYGSASGVSDKLANAGAAFVIVIVDMAIDVQSYNPALSGSLVPTFAIADYEGSFLEDVLAASDGIPLKARVELSHVTETNLTNNVIGQISGTTDEYVIVVAHQDSYFYGAIDNASGIAAMFGLAKHFAEMEEKPKRTHIFLATGGHHGGGWPGTAQFVASHLDIRDKTAIVLNSEHVAAVQLVEYVDIDEDFWGSPGGIMASNVDVPKFGSVVPYSPRMFQLFDRALNNYGVSMLSQPWDKAPGDVFPFQFEDFPVVQIIEVGNWYHTTGDILQAISVPGLERSTRAFAEFLHNVDKQSLESLGR